MCVFVSRPMKIVTGWFGKTVTTQNGLLILVWKVDTFRNKIMEIVEWSTKKVTTTTVNPGNRGGILRVRPNVWFMVGSWFIIFVHFGCSDMVVKLVHFSLVGWFFHVLVHFSSLVDGWFVGWFFSGWFFLWFFSVSFWLGSSKSVFLASIASRCWLRRVCVSKKSWFCCRGWLGYHCGPWLVLVISCLWFLWFVCGWLVSRKKFGSVCLFSGYWFWFKYGFNWLASVSVFNFLVGSRCSSVEMWLVLTTWGWIARIGLVCRLLG